MTEPEMRTISYTLKEARIVAETHQMDVYHKELMLWLCDEIDKGTEIALVLLRQRQLKDSIRAGLYG